MSPEEARDAMFGVIQTTATTESVVLNFPDVPAQVPSANQVWGRVLLRHVTGGQNSLAGAVGTVIFRAGGLLWIQLFAPKGDGGTAGYRKAQAFLNAIRKYSGSIFFRNMRVMERGDDGGFARFDVITDFEYTDIQ